MPIAEQFSFAAEKQPWGFLVESKYMRRYKRKYQKIMSAADKFSKKRIYFFLIYRIRRTDRKEDRGF